MDFGSQGLLLLHNADYHWLRRSTDFSQSRLSAPEQKLPHNPKCFTLKMTLVFKKTVHTQAVPLAVDMFNTNCGKSEVCVVMITVPVWHKTTGNVRSAWRRWVFLFVHSWWTDTGWLRQVWGLYSDDEWSCLIYNYGKYEVCMTTMTDSVWHKTVVSARFVWWHWLFLFVRPLCTYI